ncbi:MAG TPA: hypothetical protein VHE78_18660 [Gemmatimonadaceae bacterium]|nr:hypothetical protein [Gemmatimonadaceae bacterium]
MVDAVGKALDRLLRTDARAIGEQERDVYVRLARERSGDIVLCGAGGLGRKIAAGLRANGVEPLAFADNATARQGTVVDGLRVLSPEDAAREFRESAVFIVTIWGANSPHRFEHSRAQLAALGCAVMVFPPLCWKYAESMLPHYLQDLPHKVLEQKEEVRRAFDLWSDDVSRAEYVTQVRFRLTADFDGLAPPVKHPQYFPDDLYAWRDDEWMVDGGAGDGDSIRMLVQLHGDRFGHVLALEPNPVNFLKLEATVAALAPSARAKIDCRQVASAESLGVMLATAAPTFIKLDAKGAEMEALLGARETIRSHVPAIAVCVYYRQDHLWRVPLMLRELCDDYAFILRPHNEEGWNLVCYAVPRARLKRGPV